MRRIAKAGMVLVLAGGLAACGAPKDESAAPAASEAPAPAESAAASPAPGARPAAFALCATCHAVEAGKIGVGPSLAGVFGAKAGSVAGYAYSAANRNSGLTWDEATLDTYLTAPMKMMPGTKMSFAGMADPAKRKEVIEYLKTLK